MPDTSSPSAVSEPPTSRGNALLVFADPVALDLHRRRWSRVLAPALRVDLGRFSPTAAAKWDVHVFSSGALTDTIPADCHGHVQRGSKFAERLENAVQTLRVAGYARVIVVGRDCPELDAEDVASAFARLSAGTSLVLGPDQSGGCYLIGFQTEQADVLRGVRWQVGTDCAQLCRRRGATETVLLTVKMDLDCVADLRAFVAQSVQGGAALIQRVLKNAADAARMILFTRECRYDLARQVQRIRWQLPPPFVTEQTA